MTQNSELPKKILKSTNQKKKKKAIGKLLENQFQFMHSVSKAIVDTKYSAVRKREGDFMRFYL